MQSPVWIIDQIRPAGKVAGDGWRACLQRYVRAVVDRVRCCAIRGCNRIELPSIQQKLRHAGSVVREWNLPDRTGDEPVARVEERWTVFALQVEGVLREIILSTQRLGGCPLKI